MSRIVNPLVRNVCSAIFIRSKTAMRVYLIVFTPDYEGIRKNRRYMFLLTWELFQCLIQRLAAFVVL